MDLTNVILSFCDLNTSLSAIKYHRRWVDVCGGNGIRVDGFSLLAKNDADNPLRGNNEILMIFSFPIDFEWRNLHEEVEHAI